jgi:hypothetical protein
MRFYTWKGRKRSILYWSEQTGIPYKKLRERIELGIVEERIFSPIQEDFDENATSNDWEAWENLTPEQLETMREFELIGRIAKS